MELNFSITSAKRFAVAFYYAAKVYTDHRYNIKVDNGYFFDALHYYYFHITRDMKENMIPYDVEGEDENEIVYFVDTSVRGRIQIQNLTLRFNKSGTNVLSLDKFVLSLILRGNNSFPPISKLTIFPRLENRIEYDFDQQKLPYPDSELVKNLSFDIRMLRNWLLDRSIDEEVKHVFVYGYDSGIQSTLVTFLESLYPEFMDGDLTEKMKIGADLQLLRYLETNTISSGMNHTYGNYRILPLDFSSLLKVRSVMKFPNSLPKILPNEAIPEIRLPPLDTSHSIILGKGGFGTVYETYEDKEFVYKLFESKEAFEDERVALSQLNRYMEYFTNLSRVVCYDSSKLMFKMMKLIPLPKYGNPFEAANGNMPIFLQIIMGLYSMHSSGIAHNDIKFPNIMQTPDGNVQIIDYGLATTYCNKSHEFVYGTYIYNPPELCVDFRQKRNILSAKKSIMPAHDIWSTCIVMYEMLLGKPIYHFFNIDRDFRLIVSELSIKLGNENIYELRRDFTIAEDLESMTDLFELIGNDEELKILLRRCLNPNPFQRATALEILTSNYARQYIPNFIPSNIDACLRQNIIDSNPFAGYRTREERENWIRFCYGFRVFGVEYAPFFEFPQLPKELTYIDYFAILAVSQNLLNPENRVEFKWMQLPYPVPLTNGYDYKVILEPLIIKYTRLLREVPKLSINSQYNNLDEMQKVLIRAYIDGKFADMTVSEVLAN